MAREAFQRLVEGAGQAAVLPTLQDACVCVVSATPLEISALARLGWNKNNRNRLGELGALLEGAGHFMTVSQTPNSSSDRKLTARLKIAWKLYKASIATNPDRVITVRDSGGRVAARTKPQDKSSGNHYRHFALP